MLTLNVLLKCKPKLGDGSFTKKSREQQRGKNLIFIKVKATDLLKSAVGVTKCIYRSHFCFSPWICCWVQLIDLFLNKPKILTPFLREGKKNKALKRLLLGISVT